MSEKEESIYSVVVDDDPLTLHSRPVVQVPTRVYGRFSSLSTALAIAQSLQASGVRARLEGPEDWKIQL